MKIVIISDTHGNNSCIEKVYLREQGADIYLHAGDSESSESDIAPFVGVRGNCDGFFSSYPISRLLLTKAGQLLIEHRPIASEARLEDLYKEGVRIFVHGHTHKKEASISNGIHIYCPGSLSYPRDGEKGSYLVLYIDEEGIKHAFKEY